MAHRTAGFCLREGLRKKRHWAAGVPSATEGPWDGARRRRSSAAGQGSPEETSPPEVNCRDIW